MFHIGSKTRQTGQTASGTRGGKQGLMAARLQPQAGARSKFRDPGCLSILIPIAKLGHQPVAGTACLEVGLTMTFEVSRRGVQPNRNATQSPHDKIVLIGRSKSHRDVSFTH